MMPFISQTPTMGGTPTAIVYNLPIISGDQEGQQLRDVLEAIKNNQAPQVDKVHPLTHIWNQIDALNELGKNWGGRSCSS